ncbi:MAG: AcrR family transcriptional regulator [Halieaceae bacterium]|jgi:AcrR family transcriptional regulator
MPKILTPNDVLQFRQRLCDLALKAFAEQGLEGMSLRGLAAAAGCSRTTPYRYFKNKADILAAVRQAQFQRMAEENEAAALKEDDPDRRLTALARSYVSFAMANPDAYRVMFSVSQKDEQRYPELVKQIKRAQQPMKTVVDEALAKGSLHGDPGNIAHILWAGLHGIVSLHLSDKLHLGRGIDELAEVMIRSLGRAVAAKPSKQASTRRVQEDSK